MPNEPYRPGQLCVVTGTHFKVWPSHRDGWGDDISRRGHVTWLPPGSIVLVIDVIPVMYDDLSLCHVFSPIGAGWHATSSSELKALS